MFQFGYMIYVYESLASAVSNGAAFAARDDFNASSTATFVSQAQDMVVYGSAGGGGTALAPGLTTTMVNVTWTSEAAGVPQTITVSISSYARRRDPPVEDRADHAPGRPRMLTAAAQHIPPQSCQPPAEPPQLL